MAKRKRDEGEWQPPEFDEGKFMRTEILTAKLTIFVVLWAILAALASFAITLAGLAVVAFFAGLGLLFLLKWVLPILKFDISGWKRKDWLGHGMTFFFSWLAFWILLLNPPFADLTSPAIIGVTVDGANVDCGASFNAQNASAMLRVHAGDNVGVTSVTASDGTTVRPLDAQGGGVWAGPVPSNLTTIVAYDAAGHASDPCVITLS